MGTRINRNSLAENAKTARILRDPPHRRKKSSVTSQRLASGVNAGHATRWVTQPR